LILAKKVKFIKKLIKKLSKVQWDITLVKCRIKRYASKIWQNVSKMTKKRYFWNKWSNKNCTVKLNTFVNKETSISHKKL
jgi:hypothetical protein